MNLWFCRLKAVAAADRSNFQVERRVPRMAALIDQIFGSLRHLPDLQQLPVTIVILSEVTAKSTLPVMNVCHKNTSNYGRLLGLWRLRFGTVSRDLPSPYLKMTAGTIPFTGA